MRMVVLLPAPLGPSKPTISPRPTVKEMSDTAVYPAYRIVKFETSIIGPSLMCGKRSVFERRSYQPTKFWSAGNQFHRTAPHKVAGGRSLQNDEIQHHWLAFFLLMNQLGDVGHVLQDLSIDGGDHHVGLQT